MRIKYSITVLSAAFLLASCAAAPEIPPTGTPVPTLTSTSVPIPTPTVTPIPLIPQERFSKGYLEIAWPSQDLIEKGLESGVIRQRLNVSDLVFEVHDNRNHPGQQILFGREPQTREIILATRVNPKTGEMSWYTAGLRDVADAIGMTIGTQLYSPNNKLFSHSDVEKINALVVQEYNHAIVIEIGWGVWVEKFKEGEFDFSLPDEAVDLALESGMTVEGDDLIYGGSDYDYSYMGKFESQLRKQGLEDEEIRARLQAVVENHITSVMSHFRGRITEYSVLNEWRGRNTQYPDFYSKLYGNDNEFVKMVFETARKADPQARLFYNDNDINTPRQYGYPYALSYVRMLEEAGLVDAVGIQMTDIFVADPPDQGEIIATMRSWGVPVIVSSATFQVQDVSGTEQEIQERQAEVAVQMLDACVKSGVCKDFRFWDGYGDRFAFQGAETRSTIFDENMKPKSAYFAIKEYLTRSIDLET